MSCPDAEAYKLHLLARIRRSERYLRSDAEMRAFMEDAIRTMKGCFVDERLMHPRLSTVTPDWLEKRVRGFLLSLHHTETLGMSLKRWDAYHEDPEGFVGRLDGCEWAR